jgi:hypothetical protein
MSRRLSPVGQLREGHHAKLFRTPEHSGSIIAAVALHDALEARPGQKIHELREQRLAGTPWAIFGKPLPRISRYAVLCSSRHHPESRASLREIKMFRVQVERLTGQ